MKKILNYFLFFLVLAVPILLVVMPAKDILISENRNAAQFPLPPEKLRAKTIKTYFSDIDSYVADHIFLRPLLSPFSYYMIQDFFKDNLNVGRCIRGEDDWLFLGNYYSNSIGKMLGAEKVDDAVIKEGAKHLLAFKELVESQGAQLIIVVVPNKSTVYSEYLPKAFLPPAPERYLTPWVKAIQSAGVSIYDVTDDLMQEKNQGLLYYRTDSHWNFLGGHLFFKKLSEDLHWPALPPFRFIEGEPYRGDMFIIGGYSEFPLTSGDNFLLDWEEETKISRSAESNIAVNPQAVLDQHVLLLTDSFGGALAPYFEAIFKETYSWHYRRSTIDAKKFIAEHAIDVVVVVCVERQFEWMVKKIKEQL